MTQLYIKSGTNSGKCQAEAKSVTKHIHIRDTFDPKNYKEITEEHKNSTLEYHMFSKEKIYGIIKGRPVAGGNNQRDLIYKEYFSSPTVATEDVILSCIIDTEEERDVAVIDIPNKLIQG